jgi:hypothetical protein
MSRASQNLAGTGYTTTVRSAYKRGGTAGTARPRTQEVVAPMSVAHDSPTGCKRKRPRHVPVRNASHVYKSQRANGKWVFEVRHPADDKKQRRYEVVGTSLAAAKARAHEVHSAGAPVVTSLTTSLAEVVKDWQANRVGLAPATLKRYDGLLDRHVLPLLGRTKIKDINARTLLRTSNAAPSPRMAYAVIRVVLGHAVEAGALAAVPQVPKGEQIGKSKLVQKKVASMDDIKKRAHKPRFHTGPGGSR